MRRVPIATVAAGLLAVGSAEARISSSPHFSSDDRAAFTSTVEQYRGFVVPICDAVSVQAYSSFNRSRDAVFVRSLVGTEVQALYRAAVEATAMRDEQTVFHCWGPPPPPPPPGKVAVPLDHRRWTIERQQRRLRQIADDLPRFFDGGDAAFARLTALRDRLLAQGSS